MKEELQKKIEEIKLEQKIPENKKNKTRKKILCNILLAIAIMVYFMFLKLGSENTVKNIRITDFNIFSIVLLGTTIVLFERAYRKENGETALYGIEILVVALITLFFSYIIFELKLGDKIYYFNAFIGLYYIIKSICISVKDKRAFKKERLSGIKETLEPVVPEKRESHKKIKIEDKVEETEEEITIIGETPKETEKVEKVIVEEKPKKTIKKKTKEIETRISKSKSESTDTAKKEEINKEEHAPKKRGRPKKTETIKAVEEVKKEEIIEESAPKKKGRPKKAETIKVVEEVKKEESIEKPTPKKRGRPKKTEKMNKFEEVKKEETIEAPAPKKRGRPRKVVQ